MGYDVVDGYEDYNGELFAFTEDFSGDGDEYPPSPIRYRIWWWVEDHLIDPLKERFKR